MSSGPSAHGAGTFSARRKKISCRVLPAEELEGTLRHGATRHSGVRTGARRKRPPVLPSQPSNADVQRVSGTGGVLQTPPVDLPSLLPNSMRKYGRCMGGLMDIPPVAQSPCTSRFQARDGRTGGLFCNQRES